jgi:hypothetical protein
LTAMFRPRFAMWVAMRRKLSADSTHLRILIPSGLRTTFL